MSRGRRFRVGLPTGILAVLSAMVLSASMPALASAQVTDNPTVDAYVQTPPAVGEVLGARRQSPPPVQHVAARKVTPAKKLERGTLPFTGLQLILIVAGAAGLLGLGLALRRVSQPLTA